MKKYINEQKAINVANNGIQQFLKHNKFQFANISTAIFSINNIMAKTGYTLANPDGTHHNAVYYGDSGNDNITIIDKDGNIINRKLVLNWKIMDTGLGWKISAIIK